MKLKFRPLPASIGLLLIGGIFVLCGRFTVLELRNLDGKGLMALRVLPSERFSLFYVHSIYGADVAEEFEVGPSAIILKGVRTEHAGVMEYYGFDSVKPFHPLHLEFRHPLVIQKAIARDQGFIIRGKKIHLDELGQSGDRIQVSLKTVTAGAYLWQRFQRGSD